MYKTIGKFLAQGDPRGEALPDVSSAPVNLGFAGGVNKGG